MTTTAKNSTRIIGRGSEATVYLDASRERAEKRFDRAPVRIARRKALVEFNRLTEAWTRSEEESFVRVPNPIELDAENASFTMGFVNGASLLDSLLDGSLSQSRYSEVASRVARGMRLFVDLQADSTLDHILLGPDLKPTFLDFGNGAESEEGIEPTDVSAAFTELVGSTAYEISRIDRFSGISAFSRTARFLSLVGHALISENNQGSPTPTISFRSFRLAMNKRIGGVIILRQLWYRIVGLAVLTFLVQEFRVAQNHTALATARQGDAPPNSTQERRLQTIFSFVWDFPEDPYKVNNGVHRVVDGLMESLSRKGLRPVILCLGQPSSTMTDRGYTIERYKSDGFGIPTELLNRIASEGKNATTIINGLFNPRNTLLGGKMRRRGLSYFVSPHSLLTDQFFNVGRFKKLPYWHLFEKNLLNKADGIIAMGYDQEAQLLKLGIETAVVPTLNGVCNPRPATHDKFSKEGPVSFHFFGRIKTDTKGLDMLLSAVSRVSTDNNIRVTIQGPDSGDLASLNKQVEELKLDNTVTFLGPDFTSDPVQLAAKYDVSILSSRYEGVPTSVVEALLASRPVVSTRVGGLAPLMEDAGIGIIVDATIDGIEEGMRRAIASRKEWPQMGAAGRKFALTRLNWNNISNDLLLDLERLRHYV